MELNTAIQKINDMEKASYALNHAMNILYVDGDTVAPKKSWKGRGEALGYLSELSYRLLVNPETGEVLDTVLNAKDQADPKVFRQAELIREAYDEIHLFPMEEYVAYQQLLNEASTVWHDAKEKSDFPLFAPYLEKLIAFQKRFASLKDSTKHPYDVLLDTFEKGASREMLDPFFDTVRTELAPLIAEIGTRPQPDHPFLHAQYPVGLQREFAHRVMKMEGIDPACCTLGETEHPFTSGSNKWDVRITTHYYENDMASSLFSVIHEGGHALYEMGVADDLQFTSLAGGSTMGIHESQSRFYENLICRSLPFCRALLPVMRDIFPDQVGSLTAEELYAAINIARPSLIRTDADELTYPLHVLIRYEIEKAIFSGDLKVTDLPGIWNELYKKFLGLEVPDDRRGILQDSHWSGGSFGYFPSYALGSAYGVQMLRRMEADMNVWGTVEAGDLRPVTAWLGEKIHQYGRLKKPQEILLNAMGGPLDATVYTGYLQKKYRELYKL